MFAHPASNMLSDHCSTRLLMGLFSARYHFALEPTSLDSSVLHSAVHKRYAYREGNDINNLYTWKASVL